MTVTPLVIPLAAVPDQTIQAYLGTQNCVIRVYQRTFGLYVDLWLNGLLLFYGVQAFNMNKLVRNNYYNLVGDLYFFDTEGAKDPDYTGLGSRYVLLYRPDV